jgi:hypothetical protein
MENKNMTLLKAFVEKPSTDDKTIQAVKWAIEQLEIFYPNVTSEYDAKLKELTQKARGGDKQAARDLILLLANPEKEE